MKQSFEERLTELTGPEGFASAKQLLKKKMLSGGAWRNRHGRLCGRFIIGSQVVDTEVETGSEPRSFCSCGQKTHVFCDHAAALVMYAGRFTRVLNMPIPGDEVPVYYGGLNKESFEKLGKRMENAVTSYLTLDVKSALPHVPSKWENVILTVKLHSRDREYLGNLNNLRKLYFDKILSALLKLESFSLQDQQIIRFLALNGEAENSQISLNAELSAEFFHSLIGHPRFFRDGRRLTVRGTHAEVVILKQKNKVAPGLRLDGSVLPVINAKLVTGKAGCWVGYSSEYYFVPGTCEITFLRNFFRSGVSTLSGGMETENYLKRFPFPVVNADTSEPEMRKAAVLLAGELGGEDVLQTVPQ